MGRIGAPHGVRGALKVRPESADPAALLAHDAWWVRPGGGSGEWTTYRLVGGREQAGMLVVELAGIESRDTAAALRGAEVGVPRASLPALAGDEYYLADLIGMAVMNREDVVLGTVTGFVESGAHSIARVVADGVERLIPWVAQYIDGVDVPARRIDVDWPAEF
jgi:16S rRNA processing protein RimM